MANKPQPDITRTIRKTLQDIYNRGVEQGEEQPDSVYEDDLKMVDEAVHKLITLVGKSIDKEFEKLFDAAEEVGVDYEVTMAIQKMEELSQ